MNNQQSDCLWGWEQGFARKGFEETSWSDRGSGSYVCQNPFNGTLKICAFVKTQNSTRSSWLYSTIQESGGIQSNRFKGTLRCRTERRTFIDRRDGKKEVTLGKKRKSGLVTARSLFFRG